MSTPIKWVTFLEDFGQRRRGSYAQLDAVKADSLERQGIVEYGRKRVTKDPEPEWPNVDLDAQDEPSESDEEESWPTS